MHNRRPARSRSNDPYKPEKKNICECERSRVLETPLKSVTPADVKMNDTDQQQAGLDEWGSLQWCKECGDVTETYRDNGVRVHRKIGEYDSAYSRNKFTISLHEL